MLRKLAKAVAYKNAPRKTFALLHPWKALKWGAALFLAKKLFGRGKNGGRA